MTSVASRLAPPPLRFASLVPSARPTLLLATFAALAGAATLTSGSPSVPVDPDLVVVLRAMAAIKGGLAGLALAGCLWRLGRPAKGWRRLVYLAGPPLMAAGTLALWRLETVGPAALGLHLGLIALLAAALTDPDFIALPGRRADRG